MNNETPRALDALLAYATARGKSLVEAYAFAAGWLDNALTEEQAQDVIRGIHYISAEEVR